MTFSVISGIAYVARATAFCPSASGVRTKSAMVEHLLRACLPDDLLAAADFSELGELSTEYVSDELLRAPQGYFLLDLHRVGDDDVPRRNLLRAFVDWMRQIAERMALAVERHRRWRMAS